jgi:hypothetical protein
MIKNRIIYIASDQRSGSTLLDMLLNTDPNSISVGEMKYLDDFINNNGKADKFDGKCTCGKYFHKCEFWRSIIDKINPCGDSYLNNTKLVYDTIFNFYGPTCIIDSSKREGFLKRVYRENENVKVIYLLRDGRGVTNSKRERNEIDISVASYFWVRNNLKIQSALKWCEDEDKLFIKYEELCNNTEKVINILSEFTGLNKIGSSNIGKIKKHNLAGSPHKFDRDIIIKEDLRWKDSFSSIDYMKFALVGGIYNKINGYSIF